MKKIKNLSDFLNTNLKDYTYIVVFVIIMIIYAIVITMCGNIFTPAHITAIMSSQNTVIVGTMAIGMALVIITGQIDLSVGSALVLTSGIAIMVFNITDSIILTILSALIGGILCGLINGLLIGFGKMPSFVVTLGTQLIYRSVTLSFVRFIDPAISGSSSSQFALIPTNSKYMALRMGFGTGKLRLGIISISYTTILFLFLMLLFIIISKDTKYGKSVYAVGSNEKGARLAGINVTKIKISVYVITGLLVGAASFIQICKIGNVTPATSAKNYESFAIASVVLGGISMTGGRGKIIGVLFGALSYTAINYIIISIPSVSTDMQDAFQGLVLILVILSQTAAPFAKKTK